MLKQFFRNAGIALAAASFALFASAAQAQSEQQKLIADAEKVLSNFLRDPDMGWLQQQHRPLQGADDRARDSQGRLHLRRLRRRALVVARDQASGKWVGPAFYVLATRQRRLPGRHLGVGRRHDGDDRQGLQLAARDDVQDGR